MLSVKACLFITLTITIGHTIAHPFSLDDKMKTGLLVARKFPCGDGLCFCGSGEDFGDCESGCCWNGGGFLYTCESNLSIRYDANFGISGGYKLL